MSDAGRHRGPRHRERLWPSGWVWAMLLAGVGSLAVAYGAVLGPGAGIVVGLLGVLLVVLGISRWAVRIEVDEDGLRAGRATLPWQYTGRVLALDAEQTRRARGPEGDPTAHMVLRPGAGPGSVVVEVTDPEDPHATWLVATRHAGQLARAIEEARGRLSA